MALRKPQASASCTPTKLIQYIYLLAEGWRTNSWLLTTDFYMMKQRELWTKVFNVDGWREYRIKSK